ncbi:hypothetical protein Aph02nite_77620 [Actinoplanes philippinensis]|uniref:hypothetical protein n=1 Tax=Actinoplanes philippinensis TaxID=35752 RepID=UPI001160B5A1|nr:hypothetical protein [Actinoplanes philippinensis]GIE81812.1 hypothetical protein Aph02nite_77620 [Actinoplanes philippinensis]
MNEQVTGNECERQAITDHLLSLSLPELSDVLRHVLPSHAVDEEERNGLARKLVLAEVTVFEDGISNTADDRAVPIEVVAWPDRDYYGGGFGPESGLFEQGRCRRCGVDVTSTAKQAFCPICGELRHLT